MAVAELPAHRLAIRVYYEDTDAAGIVYYANYLRFAERGRSEMMRAAGVDHARLFAETGVALAVKRCAIEYVAPARLDDLIEVETRIIGARAATIDARQTVRRDGADLALLDVTLVALARSGRPTRLPPPIMNLVKPVMKN